MQRLNVFNMIHKALRAMLYDTALTIQQTHFADTEETETALNKITAVLQMFEQHAHHEDHLLFPKIEQFQPQLVCDFEDEHVTDNALGNQLATLVNIVRHTSDTIEREIAASALSRAFLDFMIFNLQHMAKEESVILPVLWRHYTDDELMAINQDIVATIPPEEKAISALWMVRGVNNAECIGWLGSLKNSLPAEAFSPVFNLTNTELPEKRRNAVQAAIMARHELV